MTTPMREHLLGYLLGALEDDEHQQVRRQLERDPKLRHDLERLKTHSEPLLLERDCHEPPAGLAARTCELVLAHRQPQL